MAKPHVPQLHNMTNVLVQYYIYQDPKLKVDRGI